MLSEQFIGQSIKNISPGLTAVALRVNSGTIMGAEPSPNGNSLKPVTISLPKKDWAVKVDSIESPFVQEYDEAEYQQNAALNLMGLYEMKTMLKAFGLPSTQQTDYLGKPLYGKSFLVAGTGTGREVINLAALGGSVIGIDATKGYVDFTADKLKKVSSVLGPNPDIKLFQCPAENYPYEWNTLDGVSSLFGVINHIENWKRQIEKYAQALKPDGKLAIEKYGSNTALVFKLRKQGNLDYQPSILQRRDPKGKGILLGDSEEVLPANFPNDWKFRFVMESNGFEIQKRIGFLRIAALFPKDPTIENINRFLKIVSQVDQEAINFLNQFNSPDELLLGSFMYDLQSQKRKINRTKIEDFAYVLYVGRKRKSEEYLTNISR